MKVTTDASLFGAWVAANMDNPQNILDIGAGTGLLALMLAQASNARIHAVEIEKECFGQLQENIAASIFNQRIEAHHQDIKTFQTANDFDTIISNPPFHQDQLKSGQLNTDLARHEAGLTLQDLFTASNALIHENGTMYVLLPFYRKDECISIADKNGWKALKTAVVRHSTKHEPFRVMFQLGRIAENPEEQEIIIHNHDGSYTEKFMQLLRPYYLYL